MSLSISIENRKSCNVPVYVKDLYEATVEAPTEQAVDEMGGLSTFGITFGDEIATMPIASQSEKRTHVIVPREPAVQALLESGAISNEDLILFRAAQQRALLDLVSYGLWPVFLFSLISLKYHLRGFLVLDSILIIQR